MPTTRQYIAAYIDAAHPLTLFQRWFFTEAQAKAWIRRNAHYLVWSKVKHC